MKSDITIHKPVSPFLESQDHAFSEGEEAIETEISSSSAFELQTPFFSEYQSLDGSVETTDPHQAELTVLMSELYDEEFNEEMYQLAAEAADYYRSRALDRGDGELAERQTQQDVEDHFAPIQEDLEIILENMIDEVDQVDLENMPDEEKDLWVESFFSEEEPFEDEGPEIEHSRRSRRRNRRKRRKERRKRRWKGFKKKAKAFVRKVGKKIGKAALKVGLKKLAKGAKKLLAQVLKTKSIKKHIPTRYLPLIDMLRKKLLKKEYADDEVLKESFAEGLAPLQSEMDYRLATSLLGQHDTSDTENELLEFDHSVEEEDASNNLAEARELLVEQLLSLEEEDDPAPQIEQFVTAILQTLRFIAKPIIEYMGRDKVIKYLAKYVAKITGKFIKKKNLNKLLAIALTDVGMKAMKLEVEPEDERVAAAEALVGMVEDTVRNSLQLPVSVFEDEALLEAEVIAIFERAAADNLPPILSEEAYRQRPHLRLSGKTKVGWMHLPLRKRRRRRSGRYKKVARAMRRKISAHTAKEVNSFGQVSLESFLEEQMGIEIGSGVEAEIHLYETLPGTALSDIANQEDYLPGLRGGYSFNYSLLHPLTPHAAGLLLGEPALGKNVPSPYLNHRHRIMPGQRFYYLDIPGAQPQTVLEDGILRLRRPSGTSVTLDFINGKIAINLFLGERAAQNIAVRLKAERSTATVLASATAILCEGLGRNFSPLWPLNIVHPSIMPGLLSGHAMRRVPPYVTDQLVAQLKDWALEALSKGFGKQTERFVAATQHPEDGVTLRIELLGVPGLATVGNFLSNVSVKVQPHLFEGISHSTRLEIHPGHDNG